MSRRKNEVLEYIQDAKVYLFGSMAQGKYTLLSDVDVLVISDRLEGIDKDVIKALVKMKYIDYPKSFT
ncbi:MAG: nucleotidyltransferase domain-containing protein [Candidatus Freyarchaeota archaeon]|nr:nucleotidyltransferase domain-containing protein [Candidatus Jordarchaeia archaeon]